MRLIRKELQNLKESMKKEYLRKIEEKIPGNEEEIKQNENNQSLPDAVIQSVKTINLLNGSRYVR